MTSLLSMLDRFEQAATGKRFRDMFEVLHNLDLDELEGAGVITPGARGGSDWTRFNNNLTTFVLKLPADRLEKLAALVDSKADRDELHAARRAIMEAFEAGWQTMDSAPTDGSEFIAVERTHSGNFYARTYRWEGPPNYWTAVRDCTCIRPEYQDRYRWIALPAALNPSLEQE